MATHSSILAWEIPQTEGNERATVCEPAEEFNMTQQLTTGEQPSAPQGYGREKALCDQRAIESKISELSLFPLRKFSNSATKSY